MARAFLVGAKRQARLPLAAPAAQAMPGTRVIMAEPVVPGRFDEHGEVATALARAGHVAFADGWRKARDGAMWRARPPVDAEELWCSALAMPEWACRLELRVMAATHARLQALSHADARAEGHRGLIPRRAFARHWDATHPVPGWRWVDDPEVVVLELERVQP